MPNLTDYRSLPTGGEVCYEQFIQLDAGRGVLARFDAFTVKGAGEDGANGLFTFHAHRLHSSGEETVLCFGGDKHPEARRAWRALPAELVRAKARTAPPAHPKHPDNLARKADAR